MAAQGFPDRQAEKTKNPRRVRGGQKIASIERAGESWAGQRWLRLVETGSEPAVQAEGLSYATLGQTRSVSFASGVLVALVQGRAPRAYRVTIAIEAFAPELWERTLTAMGDHSRYAAKLLAGELPPSIEELFAPQGVHLHPSAPGELRVSCTCDRGRSEPGAWCKHVACAALVTADRLAENPWIIFTLRGIDREEILEHLRHARLTPASSDGSAPVYSPHVAALDALAKTPLEASLGHFWEPAGPIEHLNLTPEPPPVSHPLLRRLGQSPFEQSRFPLVGLLATCYDVVSGRVLSEAIGRGEGPDDGVVPASGDDEPWDDEADQG